MIALTNATFTFPSGTRVGPFSLTAQAGERIWLRGSTGSGKSTLLRMATGLAGRQGLGTMEGSVALDQRDALTLSPRELAQTVCFVGQIPTDQLLAATVFDEVAFGLKCRNQPLTGVAAALHKVGATALADRDPLTLSGGEQQRVVLAAGLASGASIILLDEPLAQLDPVAAAELLGLLHRLSEEGATVLVVEHRDLGSWPTRTITLDHTTTPESYPAPREMGPVLAHHTLEDGDALPPLTFTVHQGERVALMGVNGSGKSTLLRALATAESGSAYVPQDPDLGLICSTVALEVPNAAHRLAFRIEDLSDRPPLALSRGQRLRVAVASALRSADLVLLDEPTSGQDPHAIASLATALAERTVVFATHDEQLARRWATRTIVLQDGRVVFDGPPSEAPAPTGTHRAARASNPRSRLDARLKVAAVLWVGGASILLDRPVSLGLLCLATLTTFLIATDRSWWTRAVPIALAIVWSTMLSQGLFYAGHPRSVAAHFVLPIYWEGLLHGLVQSMRLVSAAFAGLSLVATTSSEQLLGALRSSPIPWSASFLSVMALRAVPTVAVEWGAIRRVASRRLGGLFRRAPHRWLALEMSILLPLLARSLRRARTLAETLDLRGFDPTQPFDQPQPTMGLSERTALASMAAGGAALASAEALYQLYLAGILYVPALRPLYALVRAWL